jgi:ribosomal protein S1
LSPELVYTRIQVGEKYSVHEGSQEIGVFWVYADVWKDENRRVLVGEEYAATVMSIGWTAAGVQLENGWTAGVNSRDVGLVPWAEIGEALHVGQQLRVRVEAVDPIARKIALSVLERRQAG